MGSTDFNEPYFCKEAFISPLNYYYKWKILPIFSTTQRKTAMCHQVHFIFGSRKIETCDTNIWFYQHKSLLETVRIGFHMHYMKVGVNAPCGMLWDGKNRIKTKALDCFIASDLHLYPLLFWFSSCHQRLSVPFWITSHIPSTLFNPSVKH